MVRLRLMRQIEFRAWDKRENTMRSVQALWGNGQVYVYCNCDAEGEFLYHRDKSRAGLAHHLNGHDVNLMQFTGLKDKNGKEIYEGDIVKEVKPYGDFVHYVRWSNGNSGFWVGTSSPLTAGDAEICEVVGNIYESPELLKSK